MLYSSRLLRIQATDNDIAVEGLKKEVQALKDKCNMLERTIQNLQTRFSMHEIAVEGYRQEVLRLLNAHGALDTSYGGDSFDLAQKGI